MRCGEQRLLLDADDRFPTGNPLLRNASGDRRPASGWLPGPARFSGFRNIENRMKKNGAVFTISPCAANAPRAPCGPAAGRPRRRFAEDATTTREFAGLFRTTRRITAGD